MLRRLSALAFLIAAPSLANPVEAGPAEVSPLRCIEAGCAPLDDLEVLDGKLAGKRIVMLGEATHGDGSTFELKARLIRYLHERHGYDLVLFESGAPDLFAANRRIRNGEPADRALRDALFPIWADAREIGALTAYLDGTEIEVGGFDMQLTGARPQFLVMEIFNLGERYDLPPENFRRIASGVAVLRQEGWEGLTSLDAAAFDADVETARAGLADRAEPEAAMWSLVLQNLSHSLAYFKSIVDGGLEESDFLRREELMAKNLHALTDRLFAGRKIIVWGATSHLMGDRQVLREFADDHFESAGELHMRERGSGDDVFRIAISAFGGSRGNIFRNETIPIAEAEPQTLEAIAMEQAPGAPAALIFPDTTIEHTSRALGHRPTTGRWGEAIDAIAVIRQMEPATPLPASE